jgi:hypothetical protein
MIKFETCMGLRVYKSLSALLKPPGFTDDNLIVSAPSINRLLSAVDQANAHLMVHVRDFHSYELLHVVLL